MDHSEIGTPWRPDLTATPLMKELAEALKSELKTNAKVTIPFKMLDALEDHDADEPGAPVHGTELMTIGKYAEAGVVKSFAAIYVEDKGYTQWIRKFVTTTKPNSKGQAQTTPMMKMLPIENPMYIDPAKSKNKASRAKMQASTSNDGYDWIVSHESQQNWHMSGADPDGISSVLTRSEKQLRRVGLGLIGDRMFVCTMPRQLRDMCVGMCQDSSGGLFAIELDLQTMWITKRAQVLERVKKAESEKESESDMKKCHENLGHPSRARMSMLVMKAHNVVTKIRRATEFNQQMCVTFEIMVRGSKLYFLNIVDEGTSYQLCVPLWKEGNRFGMRIARHGNDGLDHQHGCSLTVGQSLKLSKGQALTAALAIKLQPMLHGKTGLQNVEAEFGLVQGESIFDKRMASGMRERAICGRVSARGAGTHDLSQQERPPAAWNVDNDVSDEVPRIAEAPAHVAAGVDAGDTVMEEAEPGVARQEGAEELLSVSVQPAVDAGSDSPKKTLRVDNVVIKLTQALSLDGVREWKKLLDSDAIVVHKRRQAEGANHLDTSGLKAGWCIRGYLDPALLELDTIAPTLELQIADVEGAFLRGDKLDASRGRLFIDMPRGGVEGYDDDGVIEAIKTVYGLADAPKAW
ncbi:CPK2 [Symbiodinium necroappetens]|uniref:CPK2 protein n=1 Tax=Symbiodinium necroappetens TaxID=1628268 RepID=A0A812MAG5_9DINO|nr:CPK2 [Symbiodinium necroappetens]